MVRSSNFGSFSSILFAALSLWELRSSICDKLHSVIYRWEEKESFIIIQFSKRTPGFVSTWCCQPDDSAMISRNWLFGSVHFQYHLIEHPSLLIGENELRLVVILLLWSKFFFAFFCALEDSLVLVSHEPGQAKKNSNLEFLLKWWFNQKCCQCKSIEIQSLNSVLTKAMLSQIVSNNLWSTIQVKGIA